MSEDVELVRRVIDAWNRRDLETLVRLVHADVVYVNPPTAVEPGTRRGTDEVAGVARDQWDGLLEGRLETDWIEERDGRVLVRGRMSQRISGSDARIEAPSVVAYTVRDGRLARVDVLAVGAAEVEEALRERGLSA